MIARFSTPSALAAALTLLLTLACGPTRSQPPNIVVLLADDLAPGYLGFEGHPLARTPHIDRLAEAGLILTRAYVPLAQCAPSRAALLTGLRPSQLGILTNVGARLEPEHIPIAARAKTAGYRTAFFGKWHLGNNERPQAGFEHWRPFVHPRYSNPEIWIDGQATPFNGHAPDVLVERAIDYLDEVAPAARAGAPDSPFLLWLSFKSPHAPPQLPPDPALHLDPARIQLPAAAADELQGKPPSHSTGAPRTAFLERDGQTLRQETAAYHALLAALDRSIGRLDDELERRGLTDNTLVLLLSDNGWLLGQHGMATKGPVMYEELVRVPWVLRWPAKFAGGRRSDSLVSTLDLYPTLLEAMGLPANSDLEGLDLGPLMRDPSAELREELALEYWRKRPEDPLSPIVAIVRAQAKYVRYLNSGAEELYDLVRDPGELRNLAGSPSELRDSLRTSADVFVAGLPDDLQRALVESR